MAEVRWYKRKRTPGGKVRLCPNPTRQRTLGHVWSRDISRTPEPRPAFRAFQGPVWQMAHAAAELSRGNGGGNGVNSERSLGRRGLSGPVGTNEPKTSSQPTPNYRARLCIQGRTYVEEEPGPC